MKHNSQYLGIESAQLTVTVRDVTHLFAHDHGARHAHVVALVDPDGGAGFGGDGVAVVGGGRHDGRARHEAPAVPAAPLALLRIYIGI